MKNKILKSIGCALLDTLVYLIMTAIVAVLIFLPIILYHYINNICCYLIYLFYIFVIFLIKELIE
jgi:uncharacterized membrane protein YdbT with pleckstrin-like domain